MGKVYDDVIYYIVCFIIIVAFITNGAISTVIVLLFIDRFIGIVKYYSLFRPKPLYYGMPV